MVLRNSYHGLRRLRSFRYVRRERRDYLLLLSRPSSRDRLLGTKLPCCSTRPEITPRRGVVQTKCRVSMLRKKTAAVTIHRKQQSTHTSQLIIVSGAHRINKYVPGTSGRRTSTGFRRMHVVLGQFFFFSYILLLL